MSMFVHICVKLYDIQPNFVSLHRIINHQKKIIMKTLIKILYAISFVALITSCGMFKTYVASYSVGLKTVESPANAKQQFGDTKVVNFQEGTTNKYRYEDDYINIVWYVDSKQFNFNLTNKSGHTLKINWDDISYVDYNGKTGRVMHSGVKYTERNNSQPSSSVPKGASLTDILLPTENVYYVSGQYGGWREHNLIPSIYKDEATRAVQAPKYVGKTMTIMMPIVIENVQNDYSFTFIIDELHNYPKN